MPDDVTGRDGFIVCDALATAIEVINHMPDLWSEYLDRADMAKLLEAYGGNTVRFHQIKARARVAILRGEPAGQVHERVTQEQAEFHRKAGTWPGGE
jgi:hypothetical protein